MRRIPAGLLIALWLGSAQSSHAAENPFPRVASAYLVRIQGQEVWAGESTKRLPPASLTKMMTGLLIAEGGRLDATVTVGQAAARETGSRLGLQTGDRMTAADLLTATLVRSANDACHALADWRAGSEARFVRLMNRRAAELGLRDTRFVNACGHDAPGHHASAADLAMLAETAMRLPTFAEPVARETARVRTLDGGREFLIENTNALIGRLPGAIGVKSGYTRKAGKSLVALAEREGVRVLLVLLNASNRWWDAHIILERAFALGPESRGA
jgi:D-alanyl-D-alanine carboxypeptidase (penicillin-binding protein 5/6)